MNFRTWSLVDITLPPSIERSGRKHMQKLIDEGGTGDLNESYRVLPPSSWERRLAKAYRTATTPQERITVLEYWMLGLQQRLADMTRYERRAYGDRLVALIQLAQSIINSELRTAQLLQCHEQGGEA